MFIGLLSAFMTRNFGESLASNSEGQITCISLNNRPCQARPTLVNINSNETFFYPCTVSINKCGGRFNTTDDPYAQVCVPNKVKNMNVKVFNVRWKLNKIFGST